MITTDARLTNDRDPTAHKTDHQNGGTDEIDVTGLSGVLADAQTPATHQHVATAITSGTLDGDRLPALSATKRAGVPATGTPSGKFLKDDDTWASPVSASTVTGPASATSGHVASFGDATGKVIADSGVVAANIVVTSDARLTDTRDPKTHAASHKTGQADAILLDELGTPNDNTNLNVSTARHGLVPRGTNIGNFLKDTAAWATIVITDVSGLVAALAGKAAAVHTHAEADVTDLTTDLAAKIPKATNVTAINDTGIANGEIAVFNLTNKDIRTSDVTIVTTLGATDATVPTSKAVKAVTDLLAPIASPTFTGTPTLPAGTIGIREKLTGARTYYVRTDGHNASTCSGLNNTNNATTGAFLTADYAYSRCCADIDFAGQTVTIQIADGTYAAGLSVTQPWTGGGAVVVNGNSGTPANVVLSTGAVSSIYVTCVLPGVLTVQNVALLNTSNSIVNYGIGTVAFNHIVFQTTSNNHICAVGPGARINGLNSVYTITGNAVIHAYSEAGALIQLEGSTVTITGSPTITYYAIAAAVSMIRIFSYSVTGALHTGCQKYLVVKNGVIDSNGGTLPGSVAGSTSTGGQYI